MSKPLKLLMVEDSRFDSELLVRELTHAGYDLQWKRVDTEQEFLQELKKKPDIIISDYSMPQFSGIRALDLLRQDSQNIPFILISGTVGEELAVEAMRHGADDYLLKDRIARLGNAVERALENRRLREDHHMLEDEILAREQRLNSFFKGATAGLALLDRELRYVQLNDTIAEMNGVPLDAHLGKTIHEVLPKLATVAEPILRQVLVTGQPILDAEISGETPRQPGVLRHWLVSIFPIAGRDGAIEGVGVIAVEITERKQAVEALRESEEKFRQLAENIELVFYTIDPESRRNLYVSPAFESVWGRTCASLYESSQVWVDSLHKDDKERVLKAFEACRSKGGFDQTYRIVRPDGTERWIHDRASTLRDENGRVCRILGIAEDITEKRRLEEQLRQSQKMEAIGMLASGIAHDFNNILAIIQLQAGLLKTDNLTPSQLEHAEEIENASQRAADLTRQLLMFSRRQTAQPRDVDLNDILRNVSKLLHRSLGKQIQLQIKYAPRPAMVHADPGMLDQVLLNLTVNARDALPNGGRIIIEVSTMDFDAMCVALSPRARPGRFACLAVTDTGCGIPPETMPRIFEPFFTTKAVGEGTGLGLATVFSIVHQHKGWVDAYSQVGLGTTFRVYLPLLSTEAKLQSHDTSSVSLPGGNETVLLVEDERQLRHLVHQSLERLGYRVLEAVSGPHAMEVWQANHNHIQLLVTDLVLPGGMSGMELATRLKQERDDLKVLYSSGYSPEIAGQNNQLREGANFLPKPFKPHQLARAVRACLDGQ